MSSHDDDTPVLNYIQAEWTLDMLEDSLRFGGNWEFKGKKETAAEWVSHSKFTFQSHRQKESDKQSSTFGRIIVPFKDSKIK